MRVLVVDDEAPIRHLIDRLLTGRGDNVITAADVFEAMAMLIDYQQQVDVALLDLSLPGMGGLAYADHLRRQDPDVRIVCMTGHVEEETLADAERRCESLLLKPFTKAQLFAVLPTVEQP